MLNKTLSDIRFGVKKMQIAVSSTDNVMEVEVSVLRLHVSTNCLF